MIDPGTLAYGSDAVRFYQEICALMSGKSCPVGYFLGVKRLLLLMTQNGWTWETAPPNLLDHYMLKALADVSAQTKTKYYTGVRHFLRWYSRQGVKLPQFADPILPRIRKHEQFVLRGDRLTEFARRVRLLSDPHRTLILLMLASGLRVSEAVGLRKRDIDVVKRDDGVREVWVKVQEVVIGFNPRKAKTRPMAQEDEYARAKALKAMRIRNTKSKSDRRVPLLPRAVEILRWYLVHVRPRLALCDWVFPSPKGTQITTKTVERQMRRIALTMKCPITPHTLRHSILTHLAEQEVDVKILQLIAGHEDIKTTLKYIHIAPAKIYDAVVGATKAEFLDGKEKKG